MKKAPAEMTYMELDAEMGRLRPLVPSWPFEPSEGHPERRPAYDELKAVVDELLRRTDD
jgi:hypothetical protein